MEYSVLWGDGQTVASTNGITNKVVKEVKLLSLDPTPCLQFGNATLSWLSYVPTLCVPLHLIAGPAVNCITDDDDTEDWLARFFLTNGGEGPDTEAVPWWSLNRLESDLGIVFKIHDPVVAWNDGPAITEILLYAARASTPPEPERPSLSIKDIKAPTTANPVIQVWALPLSHQLDLGNDLAIVAPPIPDQEEAVISATPLVSYNAFNAFGKSQSARLTTLFEHATPQNKQLKSKGGDRVAKVMAQREIPAMKPAYTSELQGRRKTPRDVSQHASLGPNLSSQQFIPASRHDALERTKASSLIRETSIGDVEMKSPDLEGPTLRNKTALQRAVLTGMRLYGLQQRKKHQEFEAPSRPGSEAPALATDAPAQSDDDEFRAIYNQTYKAAAFAFRKQFSFTLVDQEAIRETVDKLLILFCGGYDQNSAGSSGVGFSNLNIV